MSVYVDDMRAPFGRMVMCHMFADSADELLATIGVARKWIQHAGDGDREHFDIALSKRALAVKNGAIEMTWREYGMWRRAKREPGSSPASEPGPQRQGMSVLVDSHGESAVENNHPVVTPNPAPETR